MRTTELAYLRLVHLVEVRGRRSLWAVFRAAIAERYGPKLFTDIDRHPTLRDSPIDPTDALKQLTDALDKAASQAKRNEDVGLRVVTIAEAELEAEALIDAEYASATAWIVARLKRESWVKTALLMVGTALVSAAATYFGLPAVSGSHP